MIEYSTVTNGLSLEEFFTLASQKTPFFRGVFRQDTTFSTEMVELWVKTSKDWRKTSTFWASLGGNVWENETYVRIEYLTIPNNPDLHKLLQLKDEKTPSLAWRNTPKNGVFRLANVKNSSRLRPFVTFECSILVYYLRSFDPCKCATSLIWLPDIIIVVLENPR